MRKQFLWLAVAFAVGATFDGRLAGQQTTAQTTAQQGRGAGQAAGQGRQGTPPAQGQRGRGPAANPADLVPPPHEIPDWHYGPTKGTCIIIGGGNAEGTGLMERFIKLGGGPDNGKFVIVPTNNGNRDRDGKLIEYKEDTVIAPWLRRGLKHVVMLHTADPKVADTAEFVKPLLDATAVWMDGGRQWNMVDSYANTKTAVEFQHVLDRGGVIAGSSAGATIQGDYLMRGDTSGADVLMTQEPAHQHALGFVKHVAIDQHINTRLRWDDLDQVIKKFPDYLGIGLSEGTGIIVNGDRFEVMGKWKVAVHDDTKLYQPWEKPYYILSGGDVYDMKSRQIVKNGYGVMPPEFNAQRPPRGGGDGRGGDGRGGGVPR